MSDILAPTIANVQEFAPDLPVWQEYVTDEERAWFYAQQPQYPFVPEGHFLKVVAPSYADMAGFHDSPEASFDDWAAANAVHWVGPYQRQMYVPDEHGLLTQDEFTFEAPTRNDDGTWTAGAWWPYHVPKHISYCNFGYHFTLRPDNYEAHKTGRRIWLCEVREMRVSYSHSDKMLGTTARAIADVTAEWHAWWDDTANRDAYLAQLRATQQLRAEKEAEAERQRQEARRLQRIEEARAAGKRFIAADASPRDVVAALLHYSCPHCNEVSGSWKFEYVDRRSEIVTSVKKASFDLYDTRVEAEQEEDSEYDDYDAYDDGTKVTYSCCDDKVDPGDFDEHVFYEAPTGSGYLRDTEDWVKAAFEDLF